MAPLERANLRVTEPATARTPLSAQEIRARTRWCRAR